MSAFYDLAFQLGAFQAEADAGTMQDFAFQECVFQADAFQADICTDAPSTESPYTRFGGRKGYIIKGRRYWLTEQELAVLVAQMLEEIKRKDIKLDDPEKPKNISRKAWAEVKRTLQAIEATMLPEAEPIIRKLEKQVIDEDDDEEVLLMLY